MVVHFLEDRKARNSSDCQSPAGTSMTLRQLQVGLIYLFFSTLLFFCFMAPWNARSIAASHWEAKKCGDIQKEPVKVASLAADPSFVLLNSHVDKFNSKDDGGVSAHMTTVPAQSSVFDVLPLSAEPDFEPAMQPQNKTALLQSETPLFTVACNKGVKSNVEMDTDLLPDWELREVSYCFIRLAKKTNNIINRHNTGWGRPKWVLIILHHSYLI